MKELDLDDVAAILEEAKAETETETATIAAAMRELARSNTPNV